MGEFATRTDPLIGQMIGQYRIERQLGEGGMGIVYEAVQANLGQRVAIKVLRQNFSGDSKVLTRFFNEARAVSIVQHPGLVRISDYQQTDDGTAYIVMEFLQGESLDSRLESLGATSKKGLTTQTALQLSHQVASALAAAHAAGIVHCDLKPENIFLTRDSDVVGGERAKILDFGIAKFLAESSGKKTTVGLILGTPKYMAPEQCEGRDNLTTKVDVYALGVILYESLTGTPPFVAQSAAALMRQHMVMAPPPLRDRMPSLPAGLHELVRSMLEKDANLRPSMAKVVESLESLKAESLSGVRGRRLDRQPRAAALIGGALLLLVGGVSWFVVKLRHREPAVPAAIAASGTAGAGAVGTPIRPIDPPLSVPNIHQNTGSAPLAGAATAKAVEDGNRLDGPRKHKPGKPGPKAGLLPGNNAAVGSGSTAGGDPKSPAPASEGTAPEPKLPKGESHPRLNNSDIEPDR